ncbi:MAG: nucleotide exchange factor GrpE [Proteobacteria bacterium]|nr:nucleotide exchange factor GrpE [Pseudomonadota bacterium]
MTEPKDADKPTPDGGKAEGQPEGWEALSEEPSEGTLEPNSELEEALRAAEESLESRSEAEAAPRKSAHELTIEALSSELQALKEQHEQKLGEFEELQNRHLRLQADYENFRKRTLKERQEAHSYGHQNLVKDLLATVDNLERAIDHAHQSDGGDLQGLLQGVELVLRELLAAFGRHGVTVIEADAHPFDPTVHEAMAQAPSSEVPANTVLQVLQKGYQLRDRMLRPARVIVSKEADAAEGGVPEAGADGE